MSPSLRLALVCPRFEPVTAVGAEVQIKKLASLLSSRGHTVEVLATCVRDLMTWKNHYLPGLYDGEGFPVRRFPADPHRLSRRRLEIGVRISRGEKVTRDEQEQWIGGLGRSTALEEHITRRAGHFDAFLFAPALAGTTWGGLPAVAAKSVLLPALPDGPASRLPIVRELLSRAPAFLAGSPTEGDLIAAVSGASADRIIQAAAACGPAAEYDAGRFRRRHGIEVPFLFYTGRRTAAKGVPRLLSHVAALVGEGVDIRLVLAGEERVPVPAEVRGFVLDMYFIEEEDKADGFAACLAACQPSAREGLGLAAMESWLAGRPVLAEAEGAVTRERCRTSGGGLWYRDSLEFGECVRFLLEEPESAASLGARGGRYVREHWSWERALPQVEEALAAAAGGREGTAP